MKLRQNTYAIKAGLRYTAVKLGYHSKPSFLIIGAQKSGTSALHNYLTLHPNISPSSKKELHFFDKDLNYDRGLAWYHSHFPLPHHISWKTLCFETTPSYFYRSNVPERIYKYNPEIKLILLLRNPIDRAYSQWNMYRNLLENDPDFLVKFHRNSNSDIRRWIEQTMIFDSFHSFEDVINEEMDMILKGNPFSEPSYVRRGLYAQQLERYLNFFRLDQFIIIESSQFMENKFSILNEIIDFLTLPSYDWQIENLTVIGQTKYIQDIPSTTKIQLRDFYKSHNEELYRLIGSNFNWNMAI